MKMRSFLALAILACSLGFSALAVQASPAEIEISAMLATERQSDLTMPDAVAMVAEQVALRDAAMTVAVTAAATPLERCTTTGTLAALATRDAVEVVPVLSTIGHSADASASPSG